MNQLILSQLILYLQLPAIWIVSFIFMREFRELFDKTSQITSAAIRSIAQALVILTGFGIVVANYVFAHIWLKGILH